LELEQVMNDLDLRQDILDELEFEPSIDAADIGVAVEAGTVTLTGHVPTYSQKRKAEDIVKRVKGVRAIAENIEVRPAGTHMTADDEIAKRALNAMSWGTIVPRDAVQIKVEDGFVTLTGKVEWNYQKRAAESAVQGLAGVKSISNQISLQPSASASDVRRRTENALRRDAELEAKRISVNVADRKVTLEGKVRTFAEREAAERAAWTAPGVTSVINRITISA
jgi:osmotically-inducible protein OsmY